MDNKNTKKRLIALGYIMVLVSAIGFGSYGIWSKNIGSDFGVFTQGWVRSLIVLLILVPICLKTKQFKRIAKNDLKWALVPVLFGIATQAPLYYAYNNMSIGTATLIFYSLYLITSYIFGYFFMNETIGLPKKIALMLAIVGLGLTFKIELGVFSLLALSLAAINGVASGGEVASTKKLEKKYSSLQVSILIWLGIFLTHLPAAFINGEQLAPIGLTASWLSMLAYAVVGMAAFWLVIEGFRHIDASIGGLLGLSEVVFAVIFGIILFKEKIGLSTAIGGSLIILAAALPDLYNLLTRNKQKILK